MNAIDKTNSLRLLPAAPGTCPECATEHDPEFPHNLQSLYYKMWFYQENGRFPTMDDSLSHCSEEIKSAWMEVFAELAKERQHAYTNTAQ